MFYPLHRIFGKNLATKERTVNAFACLYTPFEVAIYRHGVGWTVYFVAGKPKSLVENKSEKSPRFLLLLLISIILETRRVNKSYVLGAAQVIDNISRDYEGQREQRHES